MNKNEPSGAKETTGKFRGPDFILDISECSRSLPSIDVTDIRDIRVHLRQFLCERLMYAR